jgi:hypothetical protein
MFGFEDAVGTSLEINSPSFALVMGRRWEVLHIEGVFGMTTSGSDTFVDTLGNDNDLEYSNIFVITNYGLDVVLDRNERLILSPSFGIGFSRSTVEISSQGGVTADTSDVSYIWQLGLSVRFMVAENHSMELVANYVSTDIPESDNTTITMKEGGLNLTLGYKYWF